MKEIIICAAIRMHDGGIIRGHRHHNCLMTASEIPRYGFKKNNAVAIEQGFMTSLNRFVDRVEAYRIFTENGQISCDKEFPMEGRNELYSEDLY